MLRFAEQLSFTLSAICSSMRLEFPYAPSDHIYAITSDIAQYNEFISSNESQDIEDRMLRDTHKPPKHHINLFEGSKLP